MAIQNASQSPSDKHVHVLLKTSSLCREMGGTLGILCKSGERSSAERTVDESKLFSLYFLFCL